MTLFDNSGRYAHHGSVSGHIFDDDCACADDGGFADGDVLNHRSADTHKHRRLGNDVTRHPNAGADMTRLPDMGFMIDDQLVFKMAESSMVT